jgi:hypothetical protein
MSKLRETCKKLLETSGIAADRQEAFCAFVDDAELTALRARWLYPLLYVVVGAIAFLGLTEFTSLTWDQRGKFFGAVVGLASALVVLWQPKVTLTQGDCEKLLGKKLAGSDLQELNAFLSLPNKTHENILKLIAAAGSFIAIYLTLR